jgi:hypothetical protein
MLNRARSQSTGEAIAKVNPLLVANELRNDIENIEWLTELLLKQEFGKLKIGQIELLDEIRRFSDHAAKQVTLLQRKEQTAKNVGRMLFPISSRFKRIAKVAEGMPLPSRKNGEA